MEVTYYCIGILSTAVENQQVQFTSERHHPNFAQNYLIKLPYAVDAFICMLQSSSLEMKVGFGLLHPPFFSRG